MRFEICLGIDYSGAATPETALPGIQAYACDGTGEPVAVEPADGARRWSRRSLAHWLADRVCGGGPALIGIDHGFSFPESYFARYGLDSWVRFLDDFEKHWPTRTPGVRVDDFRRVEPPNPRSGHSREFRLCERWTSSAKSVFQFDMQGSVAKSTHAGLPWLRWLREQCGDRLFFWPFDGWEPPPDRSVVAEVYPSMFRNRYPRAGRTVDEQDAYAVARWLASASARGALARYLVPPLTEAERRVAGVEGWILGVG